jgi:uncharacterized cysteine cluster protein YcgN (CxxCxxCC family)
MAKARDEFRSIFDQTSGIFFLACLHDERQRDFRDQFMRCAIVELGLTKIRKHSVEEALKAAEDWQTVEDVLRNFRELSVTCPIRTFCEGKPTAWYHSRIAVRPPKEIVVSHVSSVDLSQIPIDMTLALPSASKSLCSRKGHLCQYCQSSPPHLQLSQAWRCIL